jgi:ATP-dependent helicase HrpB
LRSDALVSAAGLCAHPVAAALCDALRSHRDALLVAPTGTGKSTLAPLALLAQPWRGDARILLLEPRRVAARAIAARMAGLLGERVGATVGYRMRLDTRVTSATRIEVVTEGVFARMLQNDPSLDGVACVLFDEFHERSLQADLGLALSLDARRQLGASYRIVLMSATLEVPRAEALLEGAARVEVPVSSFQVDVRYVGRGAPLLPGPGIEGAEDARRITESVVRSVQRALAETAGDVLVFLPGAGEIARAQAALQEGASPAIQTLALHGQMSGEAQDAVLAPAPAGQRKVVLATNLAETSLTIPGVTAVVDTGLERRQRFDPATGMSRLVLGRISRASSEQRRGRAGRVAPGICYRLWSEGAHASLSPATTPEILEADLAPLALDLARWGVGPAEDLAWLDPPPAPALAQARELLQRLGALTEHSRLTARGQAMARLPVHPRLGAMLLAAQAGGARAVERAARLAALLSERDVIKGTERIQDPDLQTRLELLERGGSGPGGASLERLRRSADVLAASVRPASLPPGPTVSSDQAGALLAPGFPDRVAQRREGAAGRYLLANGRGAAFVGSNALARAPYIVAAVLDDRDREARIDLAAAITVEAIDRLFADRIESRESCGWEPAAGAVLWRRERLLGALVLERQERAPPEGAETVSAMLKGIQGLGLSVLPWSDESRVLQARMEFVRRLNRAELRDWPASDDVALLATLEHWLAGWLGGVTRREHLLRVPLADALRGRLSRAQQRALESLAPRELAVPSGSQVRIDYLDDNAPCVSVRLQEVFGMVDTPRIGGGSVAITFKLLSPAHRPLQITRDLGRFWQSSYAEVRKEMRGRYPKHHWPENPRDAAPSRGTGRPRTR